MLTLSLYLSRDFRLINKRKESYRIKESNKESNKLTQRWQNELLFSDSQISLAMLATLVGLFSALVISAFRLLIDLPFDLSFLGAAHSEDFESISPEIRAILLLIGGVILIAVFSALKPSDRQTGVGHVLLRMEKHQGELPFTNLAVQFWGTITALISGFSVGREGPAVHIGAGTASQFGQWFNMPHHRLRVLVGCGVASAISASFNTPIAGVIFAMEVVLVEYSIKSFIPVILASVTGAIVSRTFFGNAPAFIVPQLDMGSLLEIPYVLLVGIVTGVLAATFILSMRRLKVLKEKPLWMTWGALMLMTIAISFFFPEVLGVGYDSVNLWLQGSGLLFIAVILIFTKLFLASWATATGFPGGLIGPSLFIGASAGYVMGLMSQTFMPEYPVSPGFYAMLGMGAMMAAVLNAPLAALMTLLELTANPNIILPGMLAIVVANLTVTEVFKLPSIFHVQTKLQMGVNPVRHMLTNTWIGKVMRREFIVTDEVIHPSSARLFLEQKHNWVFLPDAETMVPLVDLANYMNQNPDIEEINLLDIPADRQSFRYINMQANLHEALELMDQHHVEWLAVVPTNRPDQISGMISRTMIEKYYQYSPTL